MDQESQSKNLFQGMASRMYEIGGELAYAVLAKAQTLEKNGYSIIHLEIGQPDFETPEVIATAGIEAIKKGQTKYTPTLGLPPLRQTIADYVNRWHHLAVSADEVVVTPSAKTAIFMVVAALVEKGDEVIYPDPGFPAYENCIRFFGGVPKPLPLVEDKNFSFDRDKFSELLSSRTKLIILNSPSNPTGAVLPIEDLRFIAESIKDSNIFILSDEIYAKMVYGQKSAPSIIDLPGMQSQTFLVDGFSKSYSMTGWRLGYIVAPQYFLPFFDNLAVNAYACTATFVQYAGIKALEDGEESVNKMVSEFARRRDLIVSGLNNIPGVRCAVPGGAFYVFPNVQQLKLNEEVIASRLLLEAGVAVLPGTAFGQYGKGYLRLSYANSEVNIKEGISRIHNWVKKVVRV